MRLAQIQPRIVRLMGEDRYVRAMVPKHPVRFKRRSIEVGQRFGRLTVVSFEGAHERQRCLKWLCRCDCGRECVVVSRSLRNGKTSSCGCLRNELFEAGRRNWVNRLITIGQRFGRWTVVSKAGQNNHRENTWRCRCDCGKEQDVPTGSLRSGRSQSCRCLGRERRDEGLRRYRERAA